MGVSLIVANQTLGGEELDQAVRDRIARGQRRFHVLVPMTAPKQESGSWVHGFPVPENLTLAQIDEARRALEESERRYEEAMIAAEQRAEHRLEQMLERLRTAGAEADGQVGDEDPARAVEQVLADREFDEVIVSMLPGRFSRWLKMDLPTKVSRLTDAPVTAIEAADR